MLHARELTLPDPFGITMNASHFSEYARVLNTLELSYYKDRI